jgi:hypothetical protein
MFVSELLQIPRQFTIGMCLVEANERTGFPFPSWIDEVFVEVAYNLIRDVFHALAVGHSLSKRRSALFRILECKVSEVVQGILLD